MSTITLVILSFLLFLAAKKISGQILILTIVQRETLKISIISSFSFAPPISTVKKIFIYLFLAALGLGSYAPAFSSCGKRGLL